jgi:hypothetical protein
VPTNKPTRFPIMRSFYAPSANKCYVELDLLNVLFTIHSNLMARGAIKLVREFLPAGKLSCLQNREISFDLHISCIWYFSDCVYLFSQTLKATMISNNLKDVDLYELLGILSTATIQEVSGNIQCMTITEQDKDVV